MDVSETTVNSNQLKFSLKIKNFTPNVKTIFKSEEVQFAHELWFLKVYPQLDQELVGVYLYKSSDKQIKVRYKISIVNTSRKSIETKQAETSFEWNRGWGYDDFISRRKLFAAIAPDYSFTVTCQLILIKSLKLRYSPCFQFPDKLGTICLTNYFHDIHIQAQDKLIRIPAHRNIISAFSSVLHQEILKLSPSAPLKIEDFGTETVKEVLNFMYNKEVDKTDQNVMEISLMAKKYEIKDLQIECENFIFDKMTDANALNVLIFADQNQLESLCKKTVYLMKKNINAILMQNQWQDFKVEHPATFRTLFERLVPSFSDFQDERKIGNFKSLVIEENTNKKENRLISNYEALFETMELSDVIFEIDGKKLCAHKLILLSQSTVFRAMFSHDSLESRVNCIKIIDFDYDTIKQLLQFIYCDKATGLKENAINLFSAADKYNLLELKELCRNSMEQNITVDNVTKILELTNLHSSYLTNLNKSAVNFIKNNFQKVFATTAWKEFAYSNTTILNEMLVKFLYSEEVLIHIISMNKINISDNSEVEELSDNEVDSSENEAVNLSENEDDWWDNDADLSENEDDLWVNQEDLLENWDTENDLSENEVDW